MDASTVQSAGAAVCLGLAAITFSAEAGQARDDSRWLSSDELERYCGALADGSVPADAVICIGYLQGFIAGTTLAHEQVAGPAASQAQDETFAERAIRTRAASYLRRVADRWRSGYCIGDDVAPEAVLDAIDEQLEATREAFGVTAHDIVHDALVRYFPCER